MTEMVGLFIAFVVIGAVFLGVLWYLHRQHAKDRHAHSQELASLHAKMTALQQAHYDELNQREQKHQDEMTARQSEHLDKIGSLEQQISTLKDDFNAKQLTILTEHQQLLEQKQHAISKLNQRLIEQENEFKLAQDKAIKEARTQSNNIQRHVIKGQISEKFVPFMSGFEYSPADCRFMGEPMDYIVFHRLHDCADGQASLNDVSVVFLEVKTGQAKLNKRQQILKEAIRRGQVKFETVRIYQNDDTADDVRAVLDEPHTNPDKQLYPNSGSKWSEDEEQRLIQAFDGGASVDELMATHGRNYGGIISRLKRLGRYPDL